MSYSHAARNRKIRELKDEINKLSSDMHYMSQTRDKDDAPSMPGPYGDAYAFSQRQQPPYGLSVVSPSAQGPSVVASHVQAPLANTHCMLPYGYSITANPPPGPLPQHTQLQTAISPPAPLPLPAPPAPYPEALVARSAAMPPPPAPAAAPPPSNQVAATIPWNHSAGQPLTVQLPPPDNRQLTVVPPNLPPGSQFLVHVPENSMAIPAPQAVTVPVVHAAVAVPAVSAEEQAHSHAELRRLQDEVARLKDEVSVVQHEQHQLPPPAHIQHVRDIPTPPTAASSHPPPVRELFDSSPYGALDHTVYISIHADGSPKPILCQLRTDDSLRGLIPQIPSTIARGVLVHPQDHAVLDLSRYPHEYGFVPGCVNHVKYAPADVGGGLGAEQYHYQPTAAGSQSAAPVMAKTAVGSSGASYATAPPQYRLVSPRAGSSSGRRRTPPAVGSPKTYAPPPSGSAGGVVYRPGGTAGYSSPPRRATSPRPRALGSPKSSATKPGVRRSVSFQK